MAYNKTVWVDGTTVVNAPRLNNVENKVEDLDTNKSPVQHNHDTVYSALIHQHENYALVADVYKKGEIDNKISGLDKRVSDKEAIIVDLQKRVVELEAECIRLRGADSTFNNTLRITRESIGELSNLGTEEKRVLVNAINEILAKIE